MSRKVMNRKLPPPHLLQRIANNPSQSDFEASFDVVRQTVTSYLEQAGLDFASFDDILDFGCGVGRFMFAFEGHLRPGQTIRGCEVHEECARWCRENIDFAETELSSISPPLPYGGREFDLVYALSVYTHLRLDMQFLWAWEIHRVLRPGGVLFATIHGPSFFPLFHTYRDEAKAYEMYGIGEEGIFSYLVFPSQEANDQGQVQVASAHSPAAMDEQFAGFEVVRRFPLSGLAGGQDLYILRKPEHGRSVSLPIGRELEPVTQSRPDSGAVEMRFRLDGHRRFAVYPRVQPMGPYQVRFRAEIEADGRSLADEVLHPRHGRAFGACHYDRFVVDVPPHVGEATVRLTSTVVDPAAVPKGVKPSVEWCFPNFV
jgi:SAM-dependent methyltransferase